MSDTIVNLHKAKFKTTKGFVFSHQLTLTEMAKHLMMSEPNYETRHFVSIAEFPMMKNILTSLEINGTRFIDKFDDADCAADLMELTQYLKTIFPDVDI